MSAEEGSIMPHAGGRPDKLTPEVQQRLCDAVRACNYYRAACRYAEVGYTTFPRWMSTGKKATRGKFREFRCAVLKAQADAEVALVAMWRAAAPEDWRAAAELLGRRYPRRWAPRQRHEHTGRRDRPIAFTFDQIIAAAKEVEAEAARAAETNAPLDGFADRPAGETAW
jgi:hypothetical protein